MPCNKVKFKKKEAESSLKVLSNMGKPYRKEKGCYYCEECNAWHLTSNEEKKKVQNVKLSFKDKWKKLLNNK
jgi:hypothetical protein